MPGQSIPRFDLYAALGVDPSADDAEVEAAYWNLFGDQGPGAETVDDRRIVRARIARDWLTDPDLRARYEGSRSRAAARAAAKATAAAAPEDAAPETGAVAVAVAEPEPEPLDSSEIREPIDAEPEERVSIEVIPWPSADLDREPAELETPAEEPEWQLVEVGGPESAIEWSAIPPEPVESGEPVVADARPSGRMPIGILGWGALLIAGVVAVYLIYTTLGSTNTAAGPTPTPAPAQSAIGAIPSPPPTAAPTVPIAPTATPPSSDMAAMQQAAWDTLQSVATAAKDGDVATAQAMLGDTAPGLRASGLRRATFPAVTAEQVTIQADPAGWLAIADETTRLTSADGTKWTLDYGDRPLATYRSSSTDLRDLWWEESDGQHHLYVRIVYATFSEQTVSAKVAWTYDPARPDDATYFARASLTLSSVSLDDALPTQIATPTISMAGVTTVTTTGMFTDRVPVPQTITIGITITNPRTIGGADRPVDTTYVLEVR